MELVAIRIFNFTRKRVFPGKTSFSVQISVQSIDVENLLLCASTLHRAGTFLAANFRCEKIATFDCIILLN